MPAELVFSSPGAYECDIAATPEGWVMAAVCLEDVDGRFVRNMDRDNEWERAKALLYPDVTYDEWTRAFVSLRARLKLLESDGGVVSTLQTNAAEQFSGIAVCGGADPAFISTSLEGRRWSVNLYHTGESSVLHSDENILLSPSVVRDGGGTLWCAWVTRAAAGDIITIQDEGQATSLKLEGRYPCLAPTQDGVALCYERFMNGQSHVYFASIGQGTVREPVQVSSQDPLNFLPRCISGAAGEILVTWESSPAWGCDVRVDQVRRIWLKSIQPDQGRVSDGPGTEGRQGLLPVPLSSFGKGQDGARINMSPSNVRLVRMGDELVCTFRIFQPDADRRSGSDWIVDGRINRDLRLYARREGWYLCYMRWNGRSWSEPERATGPLGFSHHPYGLTASNGSVIVACHCFNPHQMPPRAHRVEVLSLNGDTPKMHEGIETFDAVPVRPANPALPAPELPQGPEGYELVFGDLHDHTSHSSCSPGLDGNPLDNMRLQRDVLGYKVLCIADHQRISDLDYRCRLDLLEREGTPGYVPIYGIEWNKQPWQHINFYSYDKEVMKHLRQILLKNLDIHLMFNQIVEQFPGKVMANRHFHDYTTMGGHGLVGDTHTYLYDPRIEWAMEALHSRGDMLATEEGMFGGPSDFPFPVNFIEWKQAKLGFVGATDHHMSKMGACSTGFWVNELTGEGVFEALRNRRTFACAGGQIAMWVHCDGIGMGQVGRAQRPIEISVSLASPVPFERISLWSDGGYIQHREVNKKQVQLSFVDEKAGPGEQYYFVRAQTQQPPDYPKAPIIAYSSPLYLTLT